jgi:hypothetical protein
MREQKGLQYKHNTKNGIENIGNKHLVYIVRTGIAITIETKVLKTHDKDSWERVLQSSAGSNSIERHWRS